MAGTSLERMPEEIVMHEDPTSGLKAVIVMHSRQLGPAAGGCRLWTYPDDTAMRADAMRLAEGMTIKNALAGVPLGGGQAVLQLPNRPFDRQRLFEAFGRIVEGLNGRYITAEDVGTNTADMKAVSRVTSFVAGLPRKGRAPGGDPSPYTARGVLAAMKIACERRIGRPLGDCTVAVQGVGAVGAALVRLLRAEGARLVLTDSNHAKAARLATQTGATLVDHDNIYSVDADIFAPCAMGAALNVETIASMRFKVVCGAANNQLATHEDAARLAARDILYAPDFAVNAGGIINVAGEYLRWSAADVKRRVADTGARFSSVLDRAERDGLLPHQAATILAE
ncbi:MAG: Glu/Leu/Phe/Val dehydrogenase [Sphingopyxis sp.]|nr:Glu/Leu/Phe/Val dehydrogenase [Sphingopyxis sp.]